MPRRANRTLYVCVDLPTWEEDVAGLSPLQRGLYEALRHHYLKYKRPLPDNRAHWHNLAGATDAKERKAVDELVALKFERREDGLLHNRICDKELARIQKQTENCRQGGKKRAEDMWGSRRAAGAIADATEKLRHELPNEGNEVDKQNEVNEQESSEDSLMKHSSVLRNINAPRGADMALRKNTPLAPTVAQLSKDAPPQSAAAPLPKLSTVAEAAWRETGSFELLAMMTKPEFERLPEWQQKVAINGWRRKNDPRFGEGVERQTYSNA